MIYPYLFLYILKKLKKNDIDVIIVGFFQQKQEWIEEDISNTILYNQELKELVKNENCYIADVFDIFQKVALKKNLKEDLVVDYMHIHQIGDINCI